MNKYSNIHLEVLNELREDYPLTYFVSKDGKHEDKTFNWDDFLEHASDYDTIVYKRNPYHYLFIDVEDIYFVGHNKVFIISVADKPHKSYWKYVEDQPLVEVQQKEIQVVKWEEIK